MMKKIFFSLLLLFTLLTNAANNELVIFYAGKLNGKLASKCEIKNNKLRFSTNNGVKLKIIPPTQDLSKYTHFEIKLIANRAGDNFRFTLTSNPVGAKKWNYYCASGVFTFSKGEQSISIDLLNLIKARQPLGKDKIQTIDFNFTGWEMPYKKGLILDIEKIVFINRNPDKKNSVKNNTKTQEIKIPSLAELKNLPAGSWIPVPDVSDRKFWNAKNKTLFGRNVIKHAKRALDTPPVAPSTDYYLDFLRNGNRTRYEKDYQQFVQNYTNLTMALCLTADKDKYFNQWQKYNEILCNMATWVFPAHDRSLDNLLMRKPHIELVGSNTGLIVATARKLLAPWISKETSDKMQNAVMRQLVTPMIETANGNRHPDWFLASTNNWNAVCIANVVQILLASDIPSCTRNFTIEFAIKHIVNYLKGFNSDGYCSEGISYWSYGFGHYLRLSAIIYAVSGGKINLLSIPQAKLAAKFPEKFMLSKNQYFPAFSDCYFNAGMSDAILFLRDYLLGYNAGNPDEKATNMLGQIAIWSLPLKAKNETKQFIPEKISSFEETGVFVFRHPEQNGILLACKGGSNNELHNHNDVGSFSISFPGSVTLLGDLGAVVYTKDSFSIKRYNNPLINSYGHPVPVVGGKLQITGPNTTTKVVKFEKNKTKAEVTFDLSNAYDKYAISLKKFERSFNYDFAGLGKIVISDSLELEKPQTFETALTTFGKIKRISSNVLQAEYRNKKVEITVNTSGIPWKLKHEIINANARWKDLPQRYAIELVGAHKKINVSMTFIPKNK